MNQVLKCNFCGRIERDAGDFLPGIFDAFICFDCLEKNSSFPINKEESAKCAFCERRLEEVSKLIQGDSANICNFCVELMLQPPSLLTRSGFVVNPNTRFGSWLLNSKNRYIRKYVVGDEPQL